MASNQFTFPGDVFVSGALVPKTVTLPAGCVANASVVAGAGIEASKVVHQFPLRYGQAPGSAVVAATVPLHICRAAGTIVAVEATIDTPPTSSDTVTVDLQSGDASNAYATVLGGVIAIDSSTAARAPESASVSTPTTADGDILRLVVAVSGTSAQGLTVVVTAQEAPQ